MSPDVGRPRVLRFFVAAIVLLAGAALAFVARDRGGLAPRSDTARAAPAGAPSVPESGRAAQVTRPPAGVTRPGTAATGLEAAGGSVGAAPLSRTGARSEGVPGGSPVTAPLGTPVVAAPSPPPVTGATPPVRSAASPAPGSPSAFTLGLRGGAAGVLEAAQALLAERAGGAGTTLRAPDGRAIGIVAAPEPESAVPAVAALDADAVRLVRVPPAPVLDDPLAALVPPDPLVGPSLEGVRLVTGEGGRAATLAALACLLADDPLSADAVLEASLPLPGPRILRAWARLLREDLPAVHAAVEGLQDDPDVGAVAHLLAGAALRADGNALEATRDFEAALAGRPAWLPAHLLAAEAYESAEVRLMDRAAAHYAAAHAAAPGDLAAAIGHAYHLAATSGDREGARRVLDATLAAHPDSVAALRMLGWWQSQGGRDEDLRAAVATFERVAAARPDDARAWSDVGSARWALVGRGGGAAAADAAIEAYGRATVLAPEDAAAWARRGGALHQAALDRAASGDVETYRTRLRQARVCYGRALALGVAPEDAARVRFDLGRMADLLPPDDPLTEDALPPRAAYASALDLDPGYVEAATALVAAEVAAGDATGASSALARLPDTTDPVERGVLEAAAAFVAGDMSRARERLTGPGGVRLEGDDVRAPLARALLVLGHLRAAIAVAGEDAKDAASWAVRARAHAALREVGPLRAALDRLGSIDRAEAERLRREPDVEAALR